MADVFGPTPVVQRGGYRFIIMFVDDATDMKFAFRMRRKSDAPEALLRLLAVLDVKSIRTDDASELMFSDFGDIVRDNKIRPEYTNADTKPHMRCV